MTQIRSVGEFHNSPTQIFGANLARECHCRSLRLRVVFQSKANGVMHIETRNLTKKYLFKTALDDVSMEIEPGQIVCVLGVNGAGKTTLLNCLAGLAIPDGGEVVVDGKEFARDDVEIRRKLHLMPDFPILFPDQTLMRNLTIMLRLYERDVPGMEHRVVELLKEFDLLAQARSIMNYLSRGQAYKGILTGLLAVDPELWLLDEPFASGMDPNGINALKAHALDASKRGRTIVYTTQILEIAEKFSTRVCVIHEGQIAAYAPLEDLKAEANQSESVLENLFRDLREADGQA
ncbi:MAG: ABC-2 type transport system ATP-binding protein [Limisphaerales bacterium]|jgi:ABC-2 type transport system ATP-binding protein